LKSAYINIIFTKFSLFIKNYSPSYFFFIVFFST